MTFQEKIENTKTFQSLNKIQKTILLSKKSRNDLSHGHKVANNIGICNFIKSNTLNTVCTNIIVEIIDNENNNTNKLLTTIDFSKKQNQIGCGYCVKEEECKIRDPKINKAKKGCKQWKHYKDSNN